MPSSTWLSQQTPAFRLMIATSWLAPDNWRKHQESSIREAINAGVDWDEYLQLIIPRHRTFALSLKALNRTPEITLP